MPDKIDDQRKDKVSGNRSQEERSREAPQPAPEAGPKKSGESSAASGSGAGYGGGRERAEQLNSQSFGDTGWSGSQAPDPLPESAEVPKEVSNEDLPEAVEPVPDGPAWDERFARENRDKYGQAGGQPIVQRGPGQSQNK